jgi:hypothetical protein
MSKSKNRFNKDYDDDPAARSYKIRDHNRLNEKREQRALRVIDIEAIEANEDPGLDPDDVIDQIEYEIEEKYGTDDVLDNMRRVALDIPDDPSTEEIGYTTLDPEKNT